MTNVHSLRALMSYHVWRGHLTGRYYAGKAHYHNGMWIASGPKHDVTADVMALIEEEIARREGGTSMSEDKVICSRVDKMPVPTVPDSVVATCSACHADIWLSPHMSAVGMVLMCTTCASAEIKDDAIFMVTDEQRRWLNQQGITDDDIEHLLALGRRMLKEGRLR